MNPFLIQAMEQWEEQVLRYSLRDQLSFNFVAWKNNFDFEYAKQNFENFFEPGIIKDKLRVPRDFKDEVYLKLHPDIKMNPRKHYLHHGAAEGRRYK